MNAEQKALVVDASIADVKRAGLAVASSLRNLHHAAKAGLPIDGGPFMNRAQTAARQLTNALRAVYDALAIDTRDEGQTNVKPLRTEGPPQPPTIDLRPGTPTGPGPARRATA